MHYEKKAPKASRLSPVSLAIVSHLQDQGQCTFDQLHALFKEPALFRCNHENAHIPNPQWLRTRLAYLIEAGHLLHEVKGGIGYYGPGYAKGESKPAREPQADAPSECGVLAPPRSSSVMDGVYCPQPAPPLRAGSMDFAHCPSVQMGRTVPFTPGKVVHCG